MEEINKITLIENELSDTERRERIKPLPITGVLLKDIIE
jgi:hypothetical protein